MLRYVLTKLVNGNVEIQDLITGDVSILLPSKNVFLYKNNVYKDQLFIKISNDPNYSLQTLGVILKYDEIDFDACTPPITSLTPEGVIQELGTNFFFNLTGGGGGGDYYTKIQIDTMLASLSLLTDEFLYEVDVYGDLTTVAPSPNVGDRAKVDYPSGDIFFGLGTRYPAGIYLYNGVSWELEGDYYQIIDKLKEITDNYATITQLDTKLPHGGYVGTAQDLQNSILNLYEITKERFETINNNLKSYPYVISYTGNNISTVVYTTGLGTITKTYAYAMGKLQSITLSGAIPVGISIQKQFNYTGNNLTSVNYV